MLQIHNTGLRNADPDPEQDPEPDPNLSEASEAYSVGTGWGAE